jgi:hypothetical protein
MMRYLGGFRESIGRECQHVLERILVGVVVALTALLRHSIRFASSSSACARAGLHRREEDGGEEENHQTRD